MTLLFGLIAEHCRSSTATVKRCVHASVLCAVPRTQHADTKDHDRLQVKTCYLMWYSCEYLCHQQFYYECNHPIMCFSFPSCSVTSDVTFTCRGRQKYYVIFYLHLLLNTFCVNTAEQVTDYVKTHKWNGPVSQPSQIWFSAQRNIHVVTAPERLARSGV